jgi:hypothetical protein
LLDTASKFLPTRHIYTKTVTWFGVKNQNALKNSDHNTTKDVVEYEARGNEQHIVQAKPYSASTLTIKSVKSSV